jgi:hypothetical protein
MKSGLPVMNFFANGIANGNYEVYATVYTANTGRNMTYYYGYTPTTPTASSFNTVGGSGGSQQVTKYDIGTISVTNGSFNIYVQDAELMSTATNTYPIFAWQIITLSPK